MDGLGEYLEDYMETFLGYLKYFQNQLHNFLHANIYNFLLANCWKHKRPKDQVTNTTHSLRSEGNVIGKLTKYKQISAKRRGE